jgi:hypothetical protein
MSAGQFLCECGAAAGGKGCGHEEYFNKLKTFEIPVAVDESLNQVGVGRRFLVRKECLEDFVQELKALRLLTDMTRRYMGASWFLRMTRVRNVAKLQFIINIRLKGIEETKKISWRSATMFALPFPPTSKPAFLVSRWLYRYWQWADTHQLEWRWHLITPRLWLIRKIDSWH